MILASPRRLVSSALSPSALSLAAVAVSLALAACGGESGEVADPAPGPVDPGPGGSPGTPAPVTPGTPPGAPGTPGTPTGATVTLSLRGITTPVAHDDGFQGQTPTRQIVAVRSLWLYRTPTDPAPVAIADLPTAVETDLTTGLRNDIATVSLASLPAGTFTLAKVGVTHVRYTIAARMHAMGVSVDGRYENVQALSQGVVVDGASRDKGWFRYAFVGGGVPYGALEGADAPLPAVPAAGGMGLDTSGPQAFYVFPVSLTIDPTVPDDLRVTCEVNVWKSFRWLDQSTFGFTAGVYDTTPVSYEPVMSFGASAFHLTSAPR